MKKAFLAMFVMALTTSAFAVSLEFKFDINSSGPSIYPCDAGLRHTPHQQRVCYEKTATGLDACDPNACDDEATCNCVCTGGRNASGEGEYRMDYMTSRYAAWTDNGENFGQTSTLTRSAGKNNFRRFFTNKNEWDHQLTSLSFNFGSERYGSEFFLDVCYRGPQIEYYLDGKLNGSLNEGVGFTVEAQATITDLLSNNGLTYSTLAGVQTKAQVVCDRQGEGTYVYAHNGGSEFSGDYDIATMNDVAETNTANGLLQGDWVFPASPSYTGFPAASMKRLLAKIWITKKYNTPRFCKVRYSFYESTRELGADVRTIRKWKRHSAQVCTYTAIEEPEDN